MNEAWCYAYNHMPDDDNSMEGILYDHQLNVDIDTFLYYQVFGCNLL
jgi:hypothetical protein